MADAPRLLFDTCTAIWTTEGDPIGREAVLALDEVTDAGERFFVSLITAWERGLLVSRGRITSPLSPKAWFERLMARPEIEILPLTHDILTDSSFLPGDIHRDPADRILVATARAFDLTIVTRDRLILDYAQKGHVRALAC